MQSMLRLLGAITIIIIFSCVSMSVTSYAQNQHSTIPSARPKPLGYMEFKLETLDPFTSASVGIQIAKPLYLEIKQTGQVSSLYDDPERVYPGLNLKLQLAKETATRPEIALGLNNAFGQSRLSSEYIVASKRYKSFDFSAGMAWGKLGGAAHIRTPLETISSHFKQDRPINDEDGNSPDHWFTGPDVGFFGGVSYQTPWDRMKLNLDWTADRYEIERGLISDYNVPSPWSVGTTIQVHDNASFHGAIVGKEKIMGRFVFSRDADSIETKQHINSIPYKIRKGDKSDFSRRYMGLTGKRYFLPERLIYASSGTTSPAEMWHALEVDDVKTSPYFRTHHWLKPHKTRIRVENKFSLSDEDNFLLFRNAAILENITETAGGLFTRFGLRLNAGDNLRGIVIPSTTKTVRRDENEFASTPITIDHAQIFKNHSFRDLHTHISAGYIEEMYAGYGGEILYRPYGRTYALGIEGWNTYRRDFDSTLNADIVTDNDGWTGFINAYYEVPNTSTTLHGKIGRYLGEDFGGTASVSHNFKNGVTATGYLTMTDEDDIDIFGSSDNVFGGLRLSIPTKPKRLKKICCDTDMRLEPLGRDTGQTLNRPSLYELSEPLSYRHVTQNWSDIKN